MLAFFHLDTLQACAATLRATGLDQQAALLESVIEKMEERGATIIPSAEMKELLERTHGTDEA